MDIDSAALNVAVTRAVVPAATNGGHPEGLNNEANQADGGRGFCSNIFKAGPEPVLPLPAASPKKPGNTRTRRLRWAMTSTRSSVHLAARPSSVPVAERTQRKLMREVDFVNTQKPPPYAAVTAYVYLYTEDLPEQAIKAIRAATRMGNKKLAKALVVLV